ncbi:crosslink repair DNA glycosylase YcaQ family protein [Nakamurella sp. A5-74]|uniref:Crosslink repair DNA glycosylase YcaQ family protein n=1 Tax=Nakamurella sp. A5-74 TaxID=3158264 RepID=A0AAU8DIZ0_9ACTN
MSPSTAAAPPALTITAAQARRTAIAAQGLHRRRTGTSPHRGTFAKLVDRIGVLQIDSVNVLARAHYLPAFSRLGAYRPELLDDIAWPKRNKDRVLLESWAHVASLVELDLEPALRFRQQAMRERWRPRDLIDANPGLLERIVEVIDEQGPISAGGIEKVLDAPGRGRPGWWEWSATKRISEYLFLSGVTSVAGRRSFERLYDLRERVVPQHIRELAAPEPDDARRTLVQRAIRHHGIGTAGDIADYYRLGVADTQRALADLIESGTVLPVAVSGWKDRVYLDAEAAMPRKVDGRALLCPFDPLIWHRPRTERLFGLHYRIEIYTPEPLRKYGYYVFPLLVGDEFVGRFDLKADRADGTLLVQASWCEPGADPQVACEAAVVELAEMARWLGLPRIVVKDRGDLARRLQGVVRTLSG